MHLQNSAQTELKKPKRKVTDAIYESGFGSSSRLYENVDATLGMSPSAMKAGGAGETIRYAIAPSALGRILVATTARGLCAVLFSNSGTEADAELAFDLRARFPQAVLRADTRSGNDSGLNNALHFALSQLTETPAAATMPFHVRASGHILPMI